MSTAGKSPSSSIKHVGSTPSNVQGKRRRVAPVSVSSSNGIARSQLGGDIASKHLGTKNKVSLDVARAQLPIAHARAALLSYIRKHRTVVLVGDTGSGKTTQLPQYLFEGRVTGKRTSIACTQPRRVAAVTVARRVAQERNATLGELVGYTVRFDDKSSPATRIKYLTDGMLLREAMTSPSLSRYSVIILDEAHERTLHTDVLFAVVKGLQKKREDLKVIIMSATLEAEKFASYFGNDCPVLYVNGRQHPVKIMYSEQPLQDYLDAVLVTVVQLHVEKSADDGDILVFLTGQEEIESLEKLLNSSMLRRPEGCAPLIVCPLYGALPAEQQLRVFEPAPPGVRKVILATNIAETSLTINGIRFVVDTGQVKQRAHNPRTGYDTLAVCPVSQAQAMQRTGRAGREMAGECYRLYTESTFATLAESTVPEILRGGMTTVVLQLLTMGVENITDFDFMDPPSADALVAALEELCDLGAINTKQVVSADGKIMAQFPVDPSLAKTILAGRALKCADDMINLVALLSVDTVFFTPHSKRDAADAARRRFLAPEGDHTTLLRVYAEYRSVSNSGGAKAVKEWCFQNFINTRSMQTVLDIRKQLRELCQRLKIELQGSFTANTSSAASGPAAADATAVRKALLAGLFTKVARADHTSMGAFKSLRSGAVGTIHPSSVLFRAKPQFILYSEMVKTTKLYFRCCSSIQGDWLTEVVPEYFMSQATT